MGEHVCPWWLAFSFDNPLRRMVHNPEKMLGPYLKEGMIALDVGCGMGYFSLGMARIVGERGRVISIDIQDQMLARVRARAENMGLSERIITIRSASERIGSPEQVDFALAFWMVHETPHKERFFSEIQALLKKGAMFLVVEPKFHVSGRQFLSLLGSARESGLQVVNLPRIGFSRAALRNAMTSYKRAEGFTQNYSWKLFFSGQVCYLRTDCGSPAGSTGAPKRLDST